MNELLEKALNLVYDITETKENYQYKEVTRTLYAMLIELEIKYNTDNFRVFVKKTNLLEMYKELLELLYKIKELEEDTEIIKYIDDSIVEMEKVKIELLKKETLDMLETQETINSIIKEFGESEKLNKRYENLNIKISENIKEIKEIEGF